MTPGKLAIICVVVGFAPLGIAALASLIAHVLGCEISEAGGSKCMFLGINIGDFLAVMFMMGWFFMFTFVFMVLGLIASGVWMLLK